MQNEDARKWRQLSRMANILAILLFFAGTFSFSSGGSWVGWSILGLAAVVAMVLSVKAGKMEVLATINMSLPVYERIRNSELNTARVRSRNIPKVRR